MKECRLITTGRCILDMRDSDDETSRMQVTAHASRWIYGQYNALKNDAFLCISSDCLSSIPSMRLNVGISLSEIVHNV